MHKERGDRCCATVEEYESMTGVQKNSGKPLTPDCPEGLATFRSRLGLRV